MYAGEEGHLVVGWQDEDDKAAEDYKDIYMQTTQTIRQELVSGSGQEIVI